MTDTDPDDAAEAAMLSAREAENRRAIEAIVLATTEPVPPTVLAQLLEVSVDAVDDSCAQLAAEYEAQGRGFQLARVAGGYRFQTHPDAHEYVERFVLEGQHARLSGPALETLAIVAYKQPISRAQLSAIRGVNVDATLKTLVARGYVEETGHEATPGNPSLFGTTSIFLERLSLDSLDQLPALAEFVPESHVVEALERGLLVPGATRRDAVNAADDAVDPDESTSAERRPDSDDAIFVDLRDGLGDAPSSL